MGLVNEQVVAARLLEAHAVIGPVVEQLRDALLQAELRRFEVLHPRLGRAALPRGVAGLGRQGVELALVLVAELASLPARQFAVGTEMSGPTAAAVREAAALVRGLLREEASAPARKMNNDG